MSTGVRVRFDDLEGADSGQRALDDGRARDVETGLYNETFMREMLARLFKLYDRGNGPGISVFVFSANAVGDPGSVDEGAMRARVAQVLSSGTRGSDIPVHLGNGVMAVFLVGARPDMLQPVAERIGQAIRQHRSGSQSVQISGGIAMRRQRESLEALLGRARAAMDEAGKSRNRILAAVEYFPV